MRSLDICIRELCSVAAHPRESIRAAMAESGKPAVGLFPLFLPEELVYAEGYLPVGLWGGVADFQKADRYLQSFCCTVLRANMELAMAGEYDFLRAILVPSQCDSLKCVCENMKVACPKIPIIGVTIPHNRSIPAAEAQLLAEFEYITASLRALSAPPGEAPGLTEAFAVYEEYRETMRRFTAMAPDYLQTITPTIRHQIIKAGHFMDKRSYTAQLKELLGLLEASPKETFTGTRFVVTGIMMDSPQFLALLEELNIGIVGDMLAHESLQFDTESDGSGRTSTRLASRLLRLSGASVLYEPGKPRGERLAELAKARGADAVLFLLLKFCDPDAFDQPLVKKDLEAAGVTMLSLEADQHIDAVGQLRTRLQAFLEMQMH